MDRLLHRPPSSLYSLINRLCFVLPMVAVCVAIILAVTDNLAPDWPLPSTSEDLLCGAILALGFWLLLAWLARRVSERDEAEARLQTLYKTSYAVANASGMEALLRIALDMPEQVLGQVAASLMLRAAPGGPRLLAGCRGLTEPQKAALEAFCAGVGDQIDCDRAGAPEAVALLNNAGPPVFVSALCLPLSKDRPHDVLLHVYLTEQITPPADARHMLESLADGLAVALDRVRLRDQEDQMLRRIEEALQTQEAASATVRQMLVHVSTAFEADASAVFLAPHEQGLLSGIPAACWPDDEPCPALAETAKAVLPTTAPALNELLPNVGYTLAVPLQAEGRNLGVVILVRSSPFLASQLSYLRVAAGMMALVVRNSQLYAALQNQAVLEERTRLAREVHDNLGQSLGFLNLKVQQVERLLGRQQWDAASDGLHETRLVIDDLYAEVRQTINDLKAAPGDGVPPVERLRATMAAFARHSDLDVSFDIEGDPLLSYEVGIQLSRIMREALTNVQRHAQARHVWICLRGEPETITLLVRDDGVGLAGSMPPAKPESFGMRSMQERAAAVGGQLRVYSQPGEGTCIQVIVPMDRVARA